MLATLYYNLSKEGFLDSIKKVQAAMAAGGAGDVIAGIYMEGPYMNPKFGAMPERNKWKGAITEEAYKEVVDTVGTDAYIWSVAPEREGIEGFVADAKAVDPKVVFSVAHSEATPQQIEALMPYGLKLATHHTNATGTLHKYPECRGVCVDEAVWQNHEIYAELICDKVGIHVDPYLQRLIRKIKGDDRIILISDSFVEHGPIPEGYDGADDINFDFAGEIAGTRLTMDQACRNIATHTGASVCQAFKFAATNPARVLNLTDRGCLAVGKLADLVICDHVFNVRHVIFRGEQVK